MRSGSYATPSLFKYGPFVTSTAHEPWAKALRQSVQAFAGFIKATIKGVLLFFSILPIVTAAAAVVGCLTLSNGDPAFLIDPQKLFDFVFNTRAGLKVNIVFVTFLLFFFCVNNGLLTRSWISRPAPGVVHI